jgi:hypothetical protein
MSDRDFFAAVAMHALVLGSETYRNSPVAAKERAFLIADQMVRGQQLKTEGADGQQGTGGAAGERGTAAGGG